MSSFSEQLNEIRKVSIARLFCDNSDSITHMQRSAFEKVSAGYVFSSYIILMTLFHSINNICWLQKSSRELREYSTDGPYVLERLCTRSSWSTIFFQEVKIITCLYEILLLFCYYQIVKLNAIVIIYEVLIWSIKEYYINNMDCFW